MEPQPSNQSPPWWQRPNALFGVVIGVGLIVFMFTRSGGEDSVAVTTVASTSTTSTTTSSTTSIVVASTSTTTLPPTTTTLRFPPVNVVDGVTLPADWAASNDGMVIAADRTDLRAEVVAGPRLTVLDDPLATPIPFTDARLFDIPRRATVGEETAFSLAIETDGIVRRHVFLDDRGFLLEAPVAMWEDSVGDLFGSIGLLVPFVEPPPVSSATVSRRRDDSRLLSVRVPDLWTDKNGSAWRLDEEVVGPALAVSPDAARFVVEWDTPGIFVATTDQVRSGPRGFLEDFRFGTSCSLLGRIPVSIDTFDGFADIWIDCGDVDSTFYVIAGRGAGRLLFVEMISTGEAEDAILLDMLGSIRLAAAAEE